VELGLGAAELVGLRDQLQLCRQNHRDDAHLQKGKTGDNQL
jgi:hypothetical protein